MRAQNWKTYFTALILLTSCGGGGGGGTAPAVTPGTVQPSVAMLLALGDGPLGSMVGITTDASTTVSEFDVPPTQTSIPIQTGYVPQPITLSSFEPSTVAAFEVLTLFGSNFQPTTNGISVLFLPQSNGTSHPIGIPVFEATTSRLRVIVPVFEVGASVSVQVVQGNAQGLEASNVLSGLTIEALPAGGAPAGQVFQAYLRTSSNVMAAVMDVGAATLGQTFFDALGNTQASLDAIDAAIQTVIDNPAATVELATASGPPILVTTELLHLLDRLVTALIQAAAPHIDASSDNLPKLGFDREPLAVRGCAPNTYNATLDSFLCGVQRDKEDFAKKSADTFWWGAKLWAGLNLAALGGWAGGLVTSAGVVTSNAWQLLYGAASGFVTSHVTRGPPPDPIKLLHGMGENYLKSLGAAGTFLGLYFDYAALTDSYEEHIAPPTPPPPPPPPPPNPFQGTITGTWAGVCNGTGCPPTVAGGFTITIAANGSVTGSYSGDDSGSISGSVSDTGSAVLSASGTTGGNCTWTGQFSTIGGLSGAGSWSCGLCLCSGGWSGS